MEIIKTTKNNEPYESLYKLNVGYSLDEYETEEAMQKILNEKDSQKRISLLTMLLNGIMVKGPTVNEVSGLLKASLDLDNILDAKKPKINLENNEILVGVASSGKKGNKTINITSISCMVAAACGVYIAKACSHSTSSKTGSSDFLDICGINIQIPYDKKIEILKKHNIAFFSIEDTTPKFAKLYGGVFYAPHAMSFALAGLSFPVQIDSLAYGLAHPNVKLSAEVLKKFGIKNALIYSSTYDGIHYLDELTPIGHINLVRINNGFVEKTISEEIKEALGLVDKFDISNIKEEKDKEKNIAVALNILQGNGTEDQINAICINAAIFILLSGKAKTLKEGYLKAKRVINTKKVWNNFIKIVESYGGSEKHIIEILNNYYTS